MKAYEAPSREALGSVFVVTRTVLKTIGVGDGVIFDPGNPGPIPASPIGGSAI